MLVVFSKLHARANCFKTKLHVILWVFSDLGARCSSEVERSLMVRWVVGSILYEVDPLSYFSFQPVLHDWCNNGRGMCYPVCGMEHINRAALAVNRKE